MPSSPNCWSSAVIVNHHEQNVYHRLQAAGLRDGDSLLAVVLPSRLAATERAFALWCPGGRWTAVWFSNRFPWVQGCYPGQNRSQDALGMFTLIVPIPYTQATGCCTPQVGVLIAALT